MIYVPQESNFDIIFQNGAAWPLVPRLEFWQILGDRTVLLSHFDSPLQRSSRFSGGIATERIDDEGPGQKRQNHSHACRPQSDGLTGAKGLAEPGAPAEDAGAADQALASLLGKPAAGLAPSLLGRVTGGDGGAATAEAKDDVDSEAAPGESWRPARSGV